MITNINLPLRIMSESRSRDLDVDPTLSRQINAEISDAYESDGEEGVAMLFAEAMNSYVSNKNAVQSVRDDAQKQGIEAS